MICLAVDFSQRRMSNLNTRALAQFYLKKEWGRIIFVILLGDALQRKNPLSLLRRD